MEKNKKKRRSEKCKKEDRNDNLYKGKENQSMKERIKT